MRMKSVHLDRKLSATARVPKRSTIVESPAGRTAQTSDGLRVQRSQELGVVVQSQGSSSGSRPVSYIPNRSPPLPPGAQPKNKSPGQIDMPPVPPIPAGQQGQVIRPAFARNNTEVMIVDDSAPNSPGGLVDEPDVDNGITLADIPQLMEAAQAMEQRRSLPGQSPIPYIAELSALELAIVKHSAVLILSKSLLRDQIDLDELLELIEVKKAGFFQKLFKSGGNDKKKVKKSGRQFVRSLYPLA